MVEPRVIPDWEAAHIFLEVARCGSFRAAAQKLQQSVNALRRRLDAFERELGVPLLIRHVNGVRLTAEGSKIYAAALQMEGASFDLLHARSLSDKQVEGEVRLSISEGLGTGWLLPHLAEFQRANPKLALNLICGQKRADLHRLEADLSVQLERPKEPDLKIVKLGRLHMMFFASRSYLDTHGHPTSLSEFAKHHLVMLADDERRWEDAYQKVFPEISPAGVVLLRCNVNSTHFGSVLHGLGIGILPTYVTAIGADLVPLNLFTKGIDIWLTYRADAKRIKRVQRTAEWIMQIFSPRRFPWFRDEFIHPDQFAEVYKGGPLTNRVADLQVPR